MGGGPVGVNKVKLCRRTVHCGSSVLRNPLQQLYSLFPLGQAAKSFPTFSAATKRTLCCEEYGRVVKRQEDDREREGTRSTRATVHLSAI